MTEDGSIEGGAGLKDLRGGTVSNAGATHTPSDLDSQPRYVTVTTTRIFLASPCCDAPMHFGVDWLLRTRRVCPDCGKKYDPSKLAR